MPVYDLILKPQAKRELDKIRGQDYQRILAAFNGLREDPQPRGMAKLAGNHQPPFWRIRVGNYRIIYSIDHEETRITIARVARRSEGTYKDL